MLTPVPVNASKPFSVWILSFLPKKRRNLRRFFIPVILSILIHIKSTKNPLIHKNQRVYMSGADEKDAPFLWWTLGGSNPRPSARQIYNLKCRIFQAFPDFFIRNLIHYSTYFPHKQKSPLPRLVTKQGLLLPYGKGRSVLAFLGGALLWNDFIISQRSNFPCRTLSNTVNLFLCPNGTSHFTT